MKTMLRIFSFIILMIMFTVAANAFTEVLPVDISSFEEADAEGLSYWYNINGTAL